ncbi:hypothetical protein CBL_10482 [Carabus blaptoides fortunei]
MAMGKVLLGNLTFDPGTLPSSCDKTPPPRGIATPNTGRLTERSRLHTILSWLYINPCSTCMYCVALISLTSQAKWTTVSPITPLEYPPATLDMVVLGRNH